MFQANTFSLAFFQPSEIESPYLRSARDRR